MQTRHKIILIKKQLVFLSAFFCAVVISQIPFSHVSASVVLDNSNISDQTSYVQTSASQLLIGCYTANVYCFGGYTTTPLTNVDYSTISYVRVYLVSGSLYGLFMRDDSDNYSVMSGSWTNVSGNIWQHPVSGMSGNFKAMGVYSGSANLTLAGGDSNAGYTYDGSNGHQITPHSFAYQLCDSGGCSGGFNPPITNYTSRIISFSPTIGSSTATTTTLSADIFNNSASSSYTYVQFHLVNSSCDTALQTCIDSPLNIKIPIISSAESTVSTTTQLANGLYIGTVSLQPNTSPPVSGTSQIMSFTAGVNPTASLITFDTSQGTSTATTSDITQGCKTTVVGIPVGAFACFLFQPSPQYLNQFSQITVSDKFPFVYLYQMGGIRQAMVSASSTASTSITITLWKMPGTATSTITILSKDMIAAVPYSSTVHSIISALLYLGLAEYIYYLVRRMHDTTTPK